MDEHEGVARARESVELYTNGEFDRLRDFYAEDVVWHAGGRNPLSGDYRGRDQLFDYFERVRGLTGGSLKIEPTSVLASDKHTAMFSRVTGEREGQTLDVMLAQVFRVDADGRFVEYWALADDQDAVDAFWS